MSSFTTTIIQDNDNEKYENHIWELTGGHKEVYLFQVAINGKLLQMELDMRTTVSVVSQHEWNTLLRYTVQLEPYTGPYSIVTFLPF